MIRRPDTRARLAHLLAHHGATHLIVTPDGQMIACAENGERFFPQDPPELVLLPSDGERAAPVAPSGFIANIKRIARI